MFVNFSQLSNTPYDYCIIGSGPAGMTTAISLSEAGKHILVVEAGDFDYTEQSQDAYKGEVIGDKYYGLEEMRARYFGGTSNMWAGYCRPLDARDFKAKKDFPETKWPITKKDLDPYILKACEILEVTPVEKDDVVSTENGITKIDFKFSPPVRFGEKYKDFIETSDNLDVCLNANLTKIITDGKRVEKVLISDYQHNEIEVIASAFILATGGIENSRILLWNNHLTKGKLCGESSPLGNYWMEHPHATFGEVVLKKEKLTKDYYSLTEDKQRELKILNAGIRLNNDFQYNGNKKLIANLACTAPNISRMILNSFNLHLICGVSIMSAWEQEPVSTNRIALSTDSIDVFNIPRTNLHWKKSEKDIETIYKTAIQIGKYLIEKDIGRLRLFDWVTGNADYPDKSSFGAGHHMGGTRMGTDQTTSVVDKNCKLHTQENFYVLGSSVFPSGGHANPTFTIVQLALRLSEHLLNRNLS